MTHWIGLIGGMGSGKSTVSDLFAQKNIPIIDTDIIARMLTSTDGLAIPLLQAAFDDFQLDPSGGMNRAYMREKIIHSPEALTRLEAILHPMIFDNAKSQQIEYKDEIYGLVVLPLLIEKPIFQPLIERVLLVDCDEETQIKRVMLRSGLDLPTVKGMMALQASRPERQKIANEVIDNSGCYTRLPEKVEELHQFYKAYWQ